MLPPRRTSASPRRPWSCPLIALLTTVTLLVPRVAAAQPAPPVLPVPAPAQPAQTPAVPSAPPPPIAPTADAATASGTWAVNFETASLYRLPDDTSEQAASLRQFTYLQILGYEGEWAQVRDPRTRETAYIRSTRLGPVEAPPAYITAPPPPAVETLNLPGRIVGSAMLSFYPTPAFEAQTTALAHNTPIQIADRVQGEDGETWYRTAEGDYLPAASVRLPRPAPRTFSGRWIDADLTEPAMVVAYEGDAPVRAMLAVKGTAQWPTSTGVFAIQRRVASETMNSDTIGIPRNGPGGYYLTNVLFTQYFLSNGESLHYNYWSSNFGYGGSHGCLGLNYADAQFLWSWANVGTPVSIHY